MFLMTEAQLELYQENRKARGRKRAGLFFRELTFNLKTSLFVSFSFVMSLSDFMSAVLCVYLFLCVGLSVPFCYRQLLDWLSCLSVIIFPKQNNA